MVIVKSRCQFFYLEVRRKIIFEVEHMTKKQVMIAINSLDMGGIQRSLLAFMDHIKEYAEIDLLVWYHNVENPIQLPDYVNLIEIPTVCSPSSAIKECGIISQQFLLSCFARYTKNPWKMTPRLKKEYDIAIAYSQVGYAKYYVIDNVCAKRKYAFFHNGEYTFGDATRRRDYEYYYKYDAVCAVSKVVERLLHKTFGEELKVITVPNAILEDEILKLGEEKCIDDDIGCKLLCVSRFSVEKNILLLLEVCKELTLRKFSYQLYLVGAGEQYQEIVNRIDALGIQRNIKLIGYTANPYKYMKNCDIYIQLSNYEAEPITVKEVALFGKPMILTNIEGFSLYKNLIQGITLCEKNVDEIASSIENVYYDLNSNYSSVKLNNDAYKKIDSLIIGNEK